MNAEPYAPPLPDLESDVSECAGVKNAVTKSLGAHSPANLAKATFRALLTLLLPEDLHQSRSVKIHQLKPPLLRLKFPDLDAAKKPLALK